LDDAELFWHTEPEARVATKYDGKILNISAITAYAGQVGFLSFVITKPEFRGQGLDDVLWHARNRRLLARLRPGGTLGLDGVFATGYIPVILRLSAHSLLNSF
jgi:hypothetical protein